MGYGAYPKNGQIVAVKGPVNTALYDLENGEVYSVNPLMARIIEGWLDEDQTCKSLPIAAARCSVPLQGNDVDEAKSREPLPISSEALQVLKGYLNRHPVLAGLSDRWRTKGTSTYVDQILSYPSGPVGLDFMWLELTKSCNLFCAHCYEDAGPDHPHPANARGGSLSSKEREPVSLEQWKDILAEAARLGAKKVKFTGGEPTLYPGLMELIECARSCRYSYIEVFTNATLLEDSLLRKCASAGACVGLSLYSCDPKTHDTITGRSGSFQQTVKGIRAILAHNIPVRVGIVLMRDNLSHLTDTVEFLKGLGLNDKQIEWDYVRPTGRGEAEVSLMERDFRTDVTPFKSSSLEATSAREEGRENCDRGFAQGTCWRGKIAISSEGDVYPCVFARQMPVGKFPEMSLEEIIQGHALQRLWQITLEEVETCKDCEMRYGCFDCRALAQTTTGDLFSKIQGCRYNPYTGLMERNGGKNMKERPKKRKDIINEIVEDETVIYDPRNHNVHHLNPVAGVIWDLCDGSHTTKEIAEEILEVLEADQSQVEGDVTKTIEEFQSKGLLEEASK